MHRPANQFVSLHVQTFLPVLLLSILIFASGCASKQPLEEAEIEDTEQYSPERYDSATRERIDRWCQLIETGKNYPDRIKIEKVNDLINKAEFIYDAPQWGKGDYWATPYELLIANKGDCEDFAIAKYFTLRELGVADSKLRLTYVKSVKLDQAHMVLSYYPRHGSVPLVLDNLNPEIQPSTSRKDLIPIFSFNGTGLWTAKARGNGKLVGNADRLQVWNELRNRMDEHTSQYLSAHAQTRGEKSDEHRQWQCGQTNKP
ncbi:MAG TPA: sulfate adenylyltransferase [Gammaproteobacteria bacterium]|nr:sulfate adenylyltransferase [Gammaproteobacteria bacterium]